MTTFYGNGNVFHEMCREITLKGDTDAYREEIQARGGTWNAEEGTWSMPVPDYGHYKARGELAYFLSSRGLSF